MFQQGAVTLLRVRGVPIRAHWTLLLILPYLALALSSQSSEVAELAGVPSAELRMPPIVWGALLAVGVFASVTIHELAHVRVAMRFGGRVRSITLMIVGGVSQLSRMPRGPRQEALMAAVGPATSLALGGVLYVGFAASRGAPVDLQLGLFYLASINLMLGLFNLVPAFPMDGGRVLRAALAGRLGRERGTRIAARVGTVFAILFGLVGLWSQNLMLLIVAWFIYGGAQAEIVQEGVHSALHGMRMIDLLPRLRTAMPVIASDQPLSRVLRRMRELERLDLIVLDPLGAPITVIQASDLDAFSSAALSTVTAGELAARLPLRHAIVRLDTSANEATEGASEADAEYFVVVDQRTGGPIEVLALVAASDLAKAVLLRRLSSRLPHETAAHAAT